MKLENIVYLELNLEPRIEILQDYVDTMNYSALENRRSIGYNTFII